MQPRILHMLNRLGLNPGEIPASNVVFLRSKRKATFEGNFGDAVAACWPFHERVIQALQVRVVLCLGGDAAKPVRDHFNTDELVGEFVENNNRRWASKSYRNADGLTVISVTHPSIADWTNPATDPTVLVLDALR